MNAIKFNSKCLIPKTIKTVLNESQVSFNLVAIFPRVFLMLFLSPITHLSDQSWDPIIPKPTSVTMNNRHGHGILGLCSNMDLEYQITRGGAITDLTVTKDTAYNSSSVTCLIKGRLESRIMKVIQFRIVDAPEKIGETKAKFLSAHGYSCLRDFNTVNMFNIGDVSSPKKKTNTADTAPDSK